MGKLRQLASTLVLTATILTVCAFAQTNLTQIRDTVSNADGTPFNGTIVITWNGSSTASSGTVSPLSTSARIYNGALSVLLVPTTIATSGSYYSVIYYSTSGTAMWTETWQVPVSSNALSVSAVRQSSSTGGTGTGTGTGTTGSTGAQYATLPISISQVTNLSSSLSQITSSLNSVTTTVSGLTGSTSTSKVAFVDAETPSGTMNGTNPTFTLSQTPSPAASLELYRNGLVQTVGVDYTLSTNTITFLSFDLPLGGDVVQAYYRVTATTGSVATFADGETPSGQINGTNLTFTLAAAPNPVSSLKLYKNGMLLQQTNDYSLSGSTVTFVTAAMPQSGDSITAYYRH